jgi:hypothetical protein
MSSQVKTSVIIVSFNTREILRACLSRLFEVCEGVILEVIVVDNASRDASADMVESDFPEVRLIRGRDGRYHPAAQSRRTA